jgi:glucose-6-phosphate isomerase
LCEETDLKNNIDKYFDGDVINETENRAVLHTALRSSGNDEVNKNLDKILSISDEINNGQRLGY